MVKKIIEMKYISILIIALLSFTVQSQAQEDAISNYFEQYLEDENFTVVYISARMFQLFSKLDLEDEENQEVLEAIKDLRGIRILTTEHNTMQYYKEAKKKINTKGYEILMTVRDEDENVEFLIKEEGDKISELLLLVGGEEDFVLMSFIGTIDINKIAKLSKSMEIDGLEHLEKIEDEN